MGFFSSRIELNDTIKNLEAEIETLKADVANKSGQIAELYGCMWYNKNVKNIGSEL